MRGPNAKYPNNAEAVAWKTNADPKRTSKPIRSTQSLILGLEMGAGAPCVFFQVGSPDPLIIQCLKIQIMKPWHRASAEIDGTKWTSSGLSQRVLPGGFFGMDLPL